MLLFYAFKATFRLAIMAIKYQFMVMNEKVKPQIGRQIQEKCE